MPADSQLELAHVLFIDIVEYSERLIDEQSEAISELNSIVRNSEQFRRADGAGKLLRLPTGDGMVLAFFTSPEAPVQCAIEISRALKEKQVFTVRMGIHTGPVSRVADVDERSNVAGGGINIAQRVMDCGDAGHILLSKRVAEDLAQFRQWRDQLHDLGECEVKHGFRLGVVNVFGDGFGNPTVPMKMSRLQAAAKPALTRPLRPMLVIGAATTVLILAIALYLLFGRGEDIPSSQSTGSSSPDKSIAVMPFADLSQAKDQEYFCDGMSEEILDSLSKIEGLRVVARTSSFSFKGKTVDVSEIGQKLGVQNILEGSVRRDGNRVRITAQLINARDGFHLWSQVYEREMQSVFKLQDEITRAITDALKIKLAGAPRTRLEPNTEAYDLFLQGMFFSNKSTEADLRRSLDFFQRALEKDPNSARAWAGVAKVWTWLADAYVRPADAYPKVKEAALKAVELDDAEPEGHIYVAEVKRVLDWDMAGSDAELYRALRLDPNSASAHFFLAMTSAVQGRKDEGMEHIRASVKADPLSPLVSNFASLGYLCLGLVDEAIEEGKRTLELDPNFFYGSPALARAYREKGMLQPAIDLYTKAQQATGVPQSGLAIIYAEAGRESDARQILQALEKRAATTYFPGEEIATVYIALRQKDEAFKWLDRACDEHSGPIHAIAMRPEFRPLHSDPRFAAILKRIGLDPSKILSINEDMRR